MKPNPHRFRDRVCCPVSLPFELPPTPDGHEVAQDTLLIITQDPAGDDDDSTDWVKCVAVLEVGDTTWRLPFVAPTTWLLGLVPYHCVKSVPDDVSALLDTDMSLVSDYEYWACRFGLLVERWTEGEAPIDATVQALTECSNTLFSPALEMVEAFLVGLDGAPKVDEIALVDEVLDLFISVLSSMDEKF